MLAVNNFSKIIINGRPPIFSDKMIILLFDITPFKSLLIPNLVIPCSKYLLNGRSSCCEIPLAEFQTSKCLKKVNPIFDRIILDREKPKAFFPSNGFQIQCFEKCTWKRATNKSTRNWNFEKRMKTRGKYHSWKRILGRLFALKSHRIRHGN